MDRKLLDIYLEQGRTIQHKDAELFFWKNKEGKIEVECRDRFKAVVDTYRFPNADHLTFCNQAGEGYGQTDYDTILTTKTKLEDLEVLDDIIGRVFIYKGEHAWLFPFAVKDDKYDCMYWDEEGDSMYLNLTGAKIMEAWSKREICGCANAEDSAEKVLEFMRTKVVSI